MVLAKNLGLEYLNVHYVVKVGFASQDIVLSPSEWLQVCEDIRAESEYLGLEVRIEELFDGVSEPDRCAVRQQSNLMFLPDGRVFSCPLFLDLPNAHSFNWTREGLTRNWASSSESEVCRRHSSVACAAVHMLDPALESRAASEGHHVGCVLLKTTYGTRPARFADGR